VHHFDVVSGAFRPHPVTAGSAFRLRRDGLQIRFHIRPGAFGTAGHDRGAVERALLAAGDADAEVADAFRRQLAFAARGVEVKTVAAVHQDVSRFEERQEGFDAVVHRLPGFDHEENPARTLERGDELLRSMEAGRLKLAGALEKSGGLFVAAIPHRNAKMMVGQVEREVLPHHRQPGDSDFIQIVHSGRFSPFLS